MRIMVLKRGEGKTFEGFHPISALNFRRFQAIVDKLDKALFSIMKERS